MSKGLIVDAAIEKSDSSDGTGSSDFPIEVVYISVGIAVVLVILVVVIIFLVVRRSRIKKKVFQLVQVNESMKNMTKD